MTNTESSTPAPSKTKAGWKKRAVHEDVTLPSGQVVDIKLPNLPQLLKSDQIPNPLVDAAIEFASAKEVSREMLEDSFDFMVWVIPRTVVAPKIDEADVADGALPPEDLDMLAAFVSRSTDVDAVGKHLGGLDTNADWRRFRGRVTVDEIAADLARRGEGVA